MGEAFTSKLLRATSLRRNVRSLFSRPGSSVPTVDGLRAISILWVILHHVPVMLAIFVPEEVREHAHSLFFKLALNGDLGVDVFFVISGFLITRLLLEEHAETGSVSLKRFYARRAFRLLPLYYFYLLFWCVKNRSSCHTVWANVLYINNFISLPEQCVSFSWSLAIEEQFYIVFPLILLFLLKREKFSVTPLWVAFGASFLICAAVVIKNNLALPVPWFDHLFPPNDVYRWYDSYYDKPYTRFGALLCGVLVAVMLRYTRLAEAMAKRKKATALGMVAALAVVLAMAVGPGRDPNAFWPHWAGLIYNVAARNLFAFAIGYLLLLTVIPTPAIAPIRRFLSARIWYPIAQLSYGAYLIHTVVVYKAISWIPKPEHLSNWYILEIFAACILLTGAAAALLYLVIERPFMNLRPGGLRPTHAAITEKANT
jgi:peptidoglycan/LPS O-acetylase OafA/YrhL